MLISEEKLSFGINPELKRSYIIKTLPFKVAREVLKIHAFTGKGEGEQRAAIPSHIKKLRIAIENGQLTPQAFNASIDKHEIKEEGNKAKFEIDKEKPLRLVDGQQRFCAIEELFQKEDIQDLVGELPISCFIYLDGSPKVDFIHLQEGRSVDKAHMLTLNIQQKSFNDETNEYYRIALSLARTLGSRKNNSPIAGQVRFSSIGQGIPITTFLSKNASDIGTSLYGSAKILTHFDKSPVWLTEIFSQFYQIMEDDMPQMIEIEKILCPPPDGNAGGAALLIGIGNICAYRCGIQDIAQLSDDCIHRLSQSVGHVFDLSSAKQMSLQFRRELMGDFTELFLNDIVESKSIETQSGVPIPLLVILSASTFNRDKLVPMTTNQPVRKRGRPKKNQSLVELSQPVVK